MKKVLKATGIIAALVIVALAGLAIFVHAYFTSERLKGLIIPRLKEYTGREVGIEQIRLSIFKGIVIKGLSLKEQNGGRDFISAKDFILDYRFWPLLKRQLVITKVELDSPVINIIRTKDGAYNFSDIHKRPAGGVKVKPLQAKREGLPVTVAADNILVNDARANFVDESGRLPQAAADFGLDFKLRLTGLTKSGVQAAGDITIKSLRTTFKDALIDTSGTISIGDEIKFDLDSAINKERVKLSGTVKNFLKSPDATIDITSPRLDFDKLALLVSGIVKGAEAAPRPATNVPVTKAAGSPGVKVAGRILVGATKYKAYLLKDLDASYSYSSGFFTLNPVKAEVSGGDAASVSGSFSGDISASSTANAKAVEKTLSGKGVLDLAEMKVKSNKLTGLVASITGIPELNNPSFTNSVMNFQIKDRKVFLNGYLNSDGFQVNPVSGDVGFDKELAVNATLNLSPALSARLPGGDISRAFVNSDGWTVLPVKLSGTFDRPSLGLEQTERQKSAMKALEKKWLDKLNRITGGTLQQLFK